MIGVLILTHGELAAGYLSALKLITGEAENIDTLGLYHETSIEGYKEEVAAKMLKMDQGKGVIVFCDIFWCKSLQCDRSKLSSIKKQGELSINYWRKSSDGN